MIGIVDVWDTSSIAVDGLFIVQTDEKSIALLLESIRHVVLLDSSSFDDHLSVSLSSTGSLHHFSLCRAHFVRCRSGVLGFFKLIEVIVIIICFFGKLVPCFIIVKHWGNVSLEHIPFFVLRLGGQILLVKDLVIILNLDLVGLHLVPDGRKRHHFLGFSRLFR